MGQVFGMLMFVVMAIMGGVSSVGMILAIPVILVQKIYRKMKYGYKLTD